jgi:hypothetical protein
MVPCWTTLREEASGVTVSSMRYAREFLKRVFGNPAIDAVGAILVVVGALLGVAGITLASSLSALAVVVVLLYASFRAFRDVAEERDSMSTSQASQAQLVKLLADGRAQAESYLNQMSKTIALGDYDSYFEPIEEWWRNFVLRVSELSSVAAARLGSSSDIDQARRPTGATHGNMNLAPLRSFLEARVTRISKALDAVR